MMNVFLMWIFVGPKTQLAGERCTVIDLRKAYTNWLRFSKKVELGCSSLEGGTVRVNRVSGRVGKEIFI